MRVAVNYTPEFKKEVKKLKKKYPRVRDDIKGLLDDFETQGIHGDLVPDIGRTVYKVRLTNKSAKKGKSSGFRALYALEKMNTIILFHIYSKTAKNDVSPGEIRNKLKDFSQES